MARILLVEDDVDVKPLLEHMLLEHGYQVATAETVAVATGKLNSEAFDLVIADVNLPDGSGLTLVERAISAGLKVLVLTGNGLVLKSDSLAPYYYLLKPIRAAELIAAVEGRLAE